MIFFTVRRKININIRSKGASSLSVPDNMTFLPPPPGKTGESPPPNRIYCISVSEFARIRRALEPVGMQDDLQIIPEALITARNDFPALIGISNRGELERYLHASGSTNVIDDKIVNPDAARLDEQISGLRGEHVRIAIFDGLGSGAGDTIMGLTALAKVRDVMSKVAKPVFEVIYSREEYQRLQEIYRHTTLVDKLHVAPISLKQLLEFDAIFDTGGMAQRKDFNEMAIVDYFLKYFGLNPAEVPEAEKRNSLLRLTPGDEPSRRIEEIRRDNPGRKLILFHHRASTKLRTIPDRYIEKIVRYLDDHKEYLLVTVVPLPAGDLPVVDLSNLCRSFTSLCFIIGQMDGIFTVDTSIYHIADSFNVPTVVWFTSIKPDLRTKYYPTVTGILLEGAETTRQFGRHSAGEGDSLAEIENLWSGLDLEESVRELDKLCAVKNS